MTRMEETMEETKNPGAAAPPPSRHALILAGGSGTRLWPRSTDAVPKPFLPLAGDRSLIRQTFERAAEVVGAGNVWFSARASHEPLLLREFPEVAPSRLILEPSRRNTAPAIALSALSIEREDPEAVVVVLPSDQGVRDGAPFAAALRTAVEAAEGSEAFVTIGIEPTRPETGFGYLETDPAEREAAVRRVVRFVEKPPLDAARRYLAEGNFLWNAGIFVFRIPVLVRAMERLCPDILGAVRGAVDALARGDAEAYAREFGAARSQSVDYAVMERAPDVRTVPCSCGWSDVGSWEAVWEFRPRDENGNATEGRVSLVEAKENLVLASGRPVCVIGLDGIAVVDSPEGLLVTRRGAADELRAWVERELSRGGRP